MAYAHRQRQQQVPKQDENVPLIPSTSRPSLSLPPSIPSHSLVPQVCAYTACSDPQPDYALGASADARWGSKFYPGKIGKIRNVCGKCTYDMHFADGDKKYGMIAANIRPKEKSNGVGPRFKAVQAKPTGAKAAKAKAEKKNDEREKEDNNGESGASGESGSAPPAPPAPAADEEEFKPKTDAEDRHEGWASKVHATIQPEFDYKGKSGDSGGAPRFQERQSQRPKGSSSSSGTGESGASGESGAAPPAAPPSPPAPAADEEEFKPKTDAEDRHEGWASKVHATIQPDVDYKGNSGGAPRFQERKTGAADEDDKEGASGSSGAAEQPFKVPTDAEDRHDGWANKVHATVVPGAGQETPWKKNLR